MFNETLYLNEITAAEGELATLAKHSDVETTDDTEMVLVLNTLKLLRMRLDNMMEAIITKVRNDAQSATK